MSCCLLPCQKSRVLSSCEGTGSVEHRTEFVLAELKSVPVFSACRYCSVHLHCVLTLFDYSQVLRLVKTAYEHNYFCFYVAI